MPCAQLVAKHPHTPHIHHLVVLISHHNLRGDVIESATESRSLISRLKLNVRFAGVNRPAEIGQFHNIVDEHDVLWLKITMNHSILMKVHKCTYGLFDIVGGFPFGEEPFLPQDIEQ